MKPLRSLLAALAFTAAAAAASPSQASLIPFSDVISTGPTGILLTAGSAYYSYTHNINDSINTATDIIHEGFLTIRFLDVGGSENVQVSFDLSPFISLGNVANGGTVFEWDIDNDLGGLFMTSLQADGLLNVTLRVLQHGEGQVSNAIFSSSTLTGVATTPVPEPATLALLGMGLLGLGLARKRRATAV